jgi:hypothetical protein
MCMYVHVFLISACTILVSACICMYDTLCMYVHVCACIAGMRMYCRYVHVYACICPYVCSSAFFHKCGGPSHCFIIFRRFVNSMYVHVLQVCKGIGKYMHVCACTCKYCMYVQVFHHLCVLHVCACIACMSLCACIACMSMYCMHEQVCHYVYVLHACIACIACMSLCAGIQVCECIACMCKYGTMCRYCMYVRVFLQWCFRDTYTYLHIPAHSDIPAYSDTY